MEEKLRRLMKHEGINSTRLAEILGIQASGISHIMSGRNKPSYDFLLKLLQRFPQISPDWLLLDKGPMYRDEVKKQSTTSIGRSAIDAGSTYGGAVNAPMNASANFPANVPTNAAMSANASANTLTDYPANASASDLFGGSSAAVPSGTIGVSGAPGAFGVQHYGTAEGVNRGRASQSAAGFSGPDNGDIIPVPEQSSDSRSGMGGSSGRSAPSVNLLQKTDIERIVVFYRNKTFAEYLSIE